MNTTLAPLLDDIVKRIVDVAAPEKIILFGSAARGEMGLDSDIDLLIVKSGDYSRRKLAMRLHESFVGVHGPVDVLVATPEMIEKYRDVPALIYSEILKEGVEIYVS